MIRSKTITVYDRFRDIDILSRRQKVNRFLLKIEHTRLSYQLPLLLLFNIDDCNEMVLLGS